MALRNAYTDTIIKYVYIYYYLYTAHSVCTPYEGCTTDYTTGS